MSRRAGNWPGVAKSCFDSRSVLGEHVEGCAEIFGKRGYQLDLLAIDPFESQFFRMECQPLNQRLTLHAEKLGFERINGQKIELVAPLPKDFRATLNMLTKYAS